MTGAAHQVVEGVIGQKIGVEVDEAGAVVAGYGGVARVGVCEHRLPSQLLEEFDTACGLSALDQPREQAWPLLPDVREGVGLCVEREKPGADLLLGIGSDRHASNPVCGNG